MAKIKKKKMQISTAGEDVRFSYSVCGNVKRQNYLAVSQKAKRVI